MPATEQTWRDTKLLHKIFAVSSVFMLVATIWMFVKDHSRPWKPYQHTIIHIENTLGDWRKLQFATNEAKAQQEELNAVIEAARREAIRADDVTEFVEQLKLEEITAAYVARAESLLADVESLTAVAGKPEAEGQRDRILQKMKAIVASVRTSEDTGLGILKFARANRDKAVADVGLALRDGEPTEDLQAKVDKRKAEVDENQLAYDTLKTQRDALQGIVQEITAAEDAASEASLQNKAAPKQLDDANKERRSTYVAWLGPIPLPGKKWLELPIIDAFNSPRKIDNLWSEGLMIEQGSFGKVRRFDRCTTCHQSIQKIMPDTGSEPAYKHAQLMQFVLLADDLGDEDTSILSPKELLEKYYGLMLAAEGLLDIDDVTLQYVRDESAAAKAEAIGVTGAESGAKIREALLETRSSEGQIGAGLLLGDVIARIDGDPIRDPRKVMFRLLDAAEAKQPLTLTIRRGLPGPYTSHPRLDLFVGSLSPHKMSDFACTICHEGQGSATDFKWASHTPNTERERQEWAKSHGWFDNHHWAMPMYPARFAESACLKCHHAVTELEPSEKFPEPPAPTVVRGYNLIRKYGCYGCHEITGYDRGERIGPDMRLEPNFFAAALQLQADPGFGSLSADVQAWTSELAEHPERDAVRHRIYEALTADGESEQPALSKRTHANLVPLFKDVENAGVIRKPGPSLRYAAHKLDSKFMSDWIENPKRFRPNTRMPRSFGMWNHLPGKGHGDVVEDYEPLEVLGITTYLQSRSQAFEYLEPPTDLNEPPADVALGATERGKGLLQERGCLACHAHDAFPGTVRYRGEDEIVQGPDLSAIGDKLKHENGQKWLYSWIKAPSRYHARTVMPESFLDPIAPPATLFTGPVTEEDRVQYRIDPAADIVSFLLTSTKEWTPSPQEANLESLDELVLENLKDAFAEAAAMRYGEEGIPAALRDELKGAEVELLTDTENAVADGSLTVDAKLLYLGRKAISKYGCYGCHDIPGFEDAKPIGTALADWGRKDPSKLAFEHIAHYLDEAEHAQDEHDDDDDGETEEMHHFYRHSLDGGHRAGFIYQKLREPRSYDYHKTENKKYNERLRMPQFPFSAAEREAVITFVLGLVADPPSAKYIYQPDERSAAIIAGRQVLDKYNCGGCHMLEAESWSLAHAPDALRKQPATSVYPFVKTHFPPDVLSESMNSDVSGLLHTIVKGMPTLEESGVPKANDDFGDPLEDDENYDTDNLEYPFDLWSPVAIGGNVFEVGVLPLAVKSSQVKQRRSSRGGFLAKYLLQHVVQREKVVLPAAKGTEAWGWLPPPLIGEGQKVQTNWLHDFLLNPYPIRPAVVLRMPRFNMSPAEATKLVNYFAAIDNAQYPYESSERQQKGYLAGAEADYQQRLASAGVESSRFGDAMNIVTTTCVKCHIVGDFNPKGADRAKAPNLAEVSSRMRPEFMRTWVANPKSLLPYTSMPVNVPYDATATVFQPVPNQPVLYHGTTTETVDALVDLLLNFDAYAKQRSPIAPMVSAPSDEVPASAVVPSPVRRTPTPAPKPTPAPTPPAKVSAKTDLPDLLKNLPEAEGWGHLKVRFVYDGDPPSPSPVTPDKDAQFCGNFKLVNESVVVNRENGGIANVIVYLDKRRSNVEQIPIHESYLSKARDRVVLDNNGCRFEPHVAILWTPQTLILKNSDSVGHNTNYTTTVNPGQNILIPAGGEVPQQLPESELRAAGTTCNIHTWMKSWLLVKDHPYAAASDGDGMVEIKNIPVGNWTFQFWQEAEGYVADIDLNGKRTKWNRGRVAFPIEDGKTTDIGIVKFAPKQE